jgi:O-antigen/teichoic acid export membrane protein
VTATTASVTARARARADAETTAQVRGSGLLLLGRVTGLVINGASQVLVVRYLSRGDFGAFALAITVASVGHRVACAGHGQVTARFLALYLERRDYPRLLGVALLSATCSLAVTSVLLLGLLVAGPSTLGLSSGSALIRQLILVLFLLAATDALDDLLESAFAVLGNPGSIFFRKYLLTPGLLLAVSVAVVLSGGGVLVLALGYLATAVAGVAMYVLLLVRLLRADGLWPVLRATRPWVPVREVLAMGLPLISTEVLNVSLNYGGVLLLAAQAGASEVAGLRAVAPFAAMGLIVLYTSTQLFVPHLSRLYGRGDLAGMRTTYWRTAAWLVVLSLPIYLLTGPFAPAVTTTLLGARYSSSATTLALLSSGIFASALLGFSTATAMVLGRVHRLLVINLACAALVLPLDQLLLPRWGARGIAAAFAVTILVQSVATQRVVSSGLKTPFLEAGHARVLGTVAAVVVAAWLLPAGVRHHLPTAMPIAGCAGLLVVLLHRNRLQLRETFPELMGVRGVRRVLR